MEYNIDPIVQEAIDAAGGTARLAECLGIQTSSVNSWKGIPETRVLAVKSATGISRHKLRPGIYPIPDVVPKTAKRRTSPSAAADAVDLIPARCGLICQGVTEAPPEDFPWLLVLLLTNAAPVQPVPGAAG
jgi:DNA-binding transcriptional regulator YdaS (Cro superfamily)